MGKTKEEDYELPFDTTPGKDLFVKRPYIQTGKYVGEALKRKMKPPRSVKKRKM